MEKYLFTDGTNVIREVQSKEELHTLIQSTADRHSVRIWAFNTNEWISYADFTKAIPSTPPTPVKKVNERKQAARAVSPAVKAERQYQWFKKVLVAIVAGATILLIYNFTRARWARVSPATANAVWPGNVPPMDMDSLVQLIEEARGQKLDKVTRTNLRIRNTWPNRLQLSVKAEKDSSSAGLRYHDIELSLDNSTGYAVDQAVVRLTIWKDDAPGTIDTIYFKDIGYSLPARQTVTGEYRGDSLSVAFSSIRATAFNFCYAEDKTSNSGNFNDRWFCRE